MIGARELALMKRDAALINTGRGELVVEADLVEALRGRRIRCAALDVFTGINVFAADGFAVDHPLFALDNVLLTPHVAAMSEESLADSQRRGAQAVVDVLTGKRPRYPVNPAALIAATQS
jgi:D-3-phosphoglycerate dehydrogenase